MRTLILSDFHFGIPASRLGKLLDGIRSLARGYDRVILNGDTLDRYEAPGCTRQAEAWLKEVVNACSSRSGPPEMVMGNHDPAISSTPWIYLEESATLVFHGDCVADCTHPTKREEQVLAVRFRQHWAELGGRPAKFIELNEVYRRIQAQHLREKPMEREPRGVLGYLASVVTPPHKPLHILRYWRQAPRLAGRLAATFPKPVRHVVMGHTHHPGCWQSNGLAVLNTGSFMPLSTPYAISVEGPTVSLQPLMRLLRSTRCCSLPAARDRDAARTGGAKA